uniref:Alkaline phosphatase n=1 Tax=Plectus sambesii TaxID=2011161 RepID=A0A914VVD9_9BILA
MFAPKQLMVLCLLVISVAVCQEIVLPQESPEYWFRLGEEELSRRQETVRNKREKAKNVILFIGDGMGLASVTAARIHRGQMEKRHNNQDPLSWEKFPIAGLVKTYCLNEHVTDSSASATAFLSGSKVNAHTLGIDGTIAKNHCNVSREGHELESIASMAIKLGLSVGVVTTTSVTHATPAALYAHTASRWVQSDYDAQKLNLTDCIDTAAQLIDHFPGNQFKVILGGGRQKMTPNTTKDEEVDGAFGERLDKRNLVDEWRSKAGKRSYVWNRQQLLDVDFDNTDYLMGLFEQEHFSFELKNDTSNPKLSEMTAAAIRILQKNEKGYLLLVEGGVIDLALHQNYAKFAITEVLAMEKAVETARKMTNRDDTLVIVTADHSHTLTMPGYMSRNISIFGSKIQEWGKLDDLPNPALVFANGPSALRHTNGTETIQRLNLSTVDTEDLYFRQPAFIPLIEETHGGEDVGIWADGPEARLFTGTMENTFIAHAIACALCLNERMCKYCKYDDLADVIKGHDANANADHCSRQELLLLLTTAFTIGSFVILLIMFVMKITQLRQ